MGQQLFGFPAGRCRFIGTNFVLPPVCPPNGKLLQLPLLDQTERTDKRHLELVHPKQRRHGPDGTLIQHIHQKRFEQVVLMVSQSDFVAPVPLRQFEKRFAAHPRTEEAGRMPAVGRGVETGRFDEQWNVVGGCHAGRSGTGYSPSQYAPPPARNAGGKSVPAAPTTPEAPANPSPRRARRGYGRRRQSNRSRKWLSSLSPLLCAANAPLPSFLPYPSFFQGAKLHISFAKRFTV